MKRKSLFRCVLAMLAGLAAFACPAGAEGAKPPIPIQLSFDRPLEASMAPFIVASSRGMFGAEGLSVKTDFAHGSAEAIARVASGASEFALVDLNELIRFRGKDDGPQVKAVFVRPSAR